MATIAKTKENSIRAIAGLLVEKGYKGASIIAKDCNEAGYFGFLPEETILVNMITPHDKNKPKVITVEYKKNKDLSYINLVNLDIEFIDNLFSKLYKKYVVG